MHEAEFKCISYCKLLIEKKLSLSESRLWKQRDYEFLRKLIFQKTGTLLSVSTFKRLWKDQHGLPHPCTLDALASFLDYSDWHEFKQAYCANTAPTSELVESNTKATHHDRITERMRHSRSRYSFGIAVALSFTALAIILTRTLDISFLLSGKGFQVIIQIESFLLNIKLIIFP